MKFKSLNGYIDDTNYISIQIENGDNNDNIGDQVWINPDGDEMEIYANADKDVLQEVVGLFKSSNSKRAFKGALLRMGISF